VLEGDIVREVQVKHSSPASRWVWGAFRMSATGFRELKALWHTPDRQDEYFGTLVNAYLKKGGAAIGIQTGESYVDVGTLNGYRAAMTLLLSQQDQRPSLLRRWPQTREKSGQMELVND
jgi:glucose-1-phosphate thymidylyltransferase